MSDVFYKVVIDPYRYGSNAAIFIRDNRIDGFLSLLRDNPSLMPFFPVYSKGAVIKQPEEGGPLLVFKTHGHATDFLYKTQLDQSQGYLRGEERGAVIRVEGVKWSTCQVFRMMRSCGVFPLQLIHGPVRPMIDPYRSLSMSQDGVVFLSELTVLE